MAAANEKLVALPTEYFFFFFYISTGMWLIPWRGPRAPYGALLPGRAGI